MTPEEIRQLSATRELDALVAEKVMGLNVVARDWPCRYGADGGDAAGFPDDDWLLKAYDERGPVYVHENGIWPPRQMEGEPEGYRHCWVKPVPFYSRDIAAIWQVVDALARQERPWHLTLTHGWSGYAAQFHRGFEPEDVSPEAWARDKDAAAAIARAALLTTLDP